MDPLDISRRRFGYLAGGLAATSLPLSALAGPTAAEVISQIKTSLGGDWPETGLDGLKAGNPETVVTGVATTAMATLSVLQQAAKAKLNLVLTHEPTFFSARDGVAPPPAPAANGRGRGPTGLSPTDPVYVAKKEFIERNNMVVFRLHDHWQASKGKELTVGLADSLGWTKYKVLNEDSLFDIPTATLEDTVAAIRKKLAIRGGLRSVGDRKLRVKRVMLHPGLMSVATMWKNYDKVDLLIAGEVREWECTFYAFDMMTEGEKRGFITLGRVVSEEPGMRLCASWAKTLLKNVPAQWISAGDPYWRAV